MSINTQLIALFNYENTEGEWCIVNRFRVMIMVHKSVTKQVFHAVLLLLWLLQCAIRREAFIWRNGIFVFTLRVTSGTLHAATKCDAHNERYWVSLI